MSRWAALTRRAATPSLRWPASRPLPAAQAAHAPRSMAGRRPAAAAPGHRPVLRDVLELFSASSVANLLHYLFLVLLARAFAPETFGAFAAVFGLVALLNVAMAALQPAVAARLARAADDQRAALLQQAYRASWWAAAAVLAIGLAAARPLAALLHLDHPAATMAAAAIAALYLPWNVVMGGYQGGRRFAAYGRLYLLQAVLRWAALAALLLSPSPALVLALTALAMVPPLLLGAARLWPGGLGRAAMGAAPAQRSALFDRRAWTVLWVALAIGFPTLGDVVLVRHLYPADEAGLLAGVAMIGRVVLFSAAAITTVLYPGFLQDAVSPAARRRLLLAMAALAGAGGAATALAALAPETLLRAVVGGGYPAAGALLAAYTGGVALYAVGSVAAFFNAARARRGFLAVCVLPFLLLQAMLPFLLPHDLLAMALAGLAGAAGFLALNLGWALRRDGAAATSPQPRLEAKAAG